jgi:hypothetical protein
MFLSFLYIERVRALLLGLWGFSARFAVGGTIYTRCAGYIGGTYLVIGTSLSGGFAEIIDT